MTITGSETVTYHHALNGNPETLEHLPAILHTLEDSSTLLRCLFYSGDGGDFIFCPSVELSTDAATEGTGAGQFTRI